MDQATREPHSSYFPIRAHHTTPRHTTNLLHLRKGKGVRHRVEGLHRRKNGVRGHLPRESTNGDKKRKNVTMPVFRFCRTTLEAAAAADVEPNQDNASND